MPSRDLGYCWSRFYLWTRSPYYAKLCLIFDDSCLFHNCGLLITVKSPNEAKKRPCICVYLVPSCLAPFHTLRTVWARLSPQAEYSQICMPCFPHRQISARQWKGEGYRTLPMIQFVVHIGKLTTHNLYTGTGHNYRQVWCRMTSPCKQEWSLKWLWIKREKEEP